MNDFWFDFNVLLVFFEQKENVTFFDHSYVPVPPLLLNQRYLSHLLYYPQIAPNIYQSNRPATKKLEEKTD